MASNEQNKRLLATSDLLRHLLVSNPRYARAWRVRGGRQRGELNQRAVAKVIALHLWDKGDRKETETNLPQTLKNVVGRALQGERMTGATLQHFIEAFDMDESDQHALWRAFAGDAGISSTVVRRQGTIRRQWHRTLFLFERYYLDAHGRLAQRRTTQHLEAREDEVNAYLFTREPTVAEIHVIHGGFLGRHYETADDLVADDIVFHQPLLSGDRTSIEYVSTYETADRAKEIRRAARLRTENVTLTVQFHPRCVPAAARFAVWDSYHDGLPISERELEIFGSDIQVFLPSIEETVVGFRLDW